jgi:tetratricopeptide (TPR) repeat protein
MTEEEKSKGTPVDLGEDLLEGSTKSIISGPSATQFKNPFKEFEDSLQSAKILMSEGIYEEAKRTLRKLMFIDPGHAAVRKLLNEIHELELKQIFGEQPKRRSFLEKQAPIFNSEQVLKELDEYLHLDLKNLSLFEEKNFSDLSKSIEADLKVSQASLHDRLDMAVAFIEIGLYGVAIDLLEKSMAAELLEDELIAVVSLLAYVYIQAGRPHESVLILEPFVRESETQIGKKVELYYLMGRAQEALDNRALAKQWYNQVKKIDPNYRDIEERLNNKS